MKKKLAVLFSSITILSSSLFSGAVFAQDNDITVTLNGKALSLEQSPVIENGSTLVPFKQILDSLGVSVEWDAETKSLTCTKDDKTVEITINSDTMLVNGESVEVSAPAKIIDGKTFVPLRTLAESCNTLVFWDNDTKTVKIIAMSADELKELSYSYIAKVYKPSIAYCTLLLNASKLDDDSITELKEVSKKFFDIGLDYMSDFSSINSIEKMSETGLSMLLESKENSDFDEIFKTLSDIAEKNKIELDLGNGEITEYFNKIMELQGQLLEAPVPSKELNKKLTSVLSYVMLNMSSIKADNLKEFKELSYEISDFEIDALKNNEAIEKDEEKLKEIDAKYTEYIEKVSAFAKDNNISLDNIDEISNLDAKEFQKASIEFSSLMIKLNKAMEKDPSLVELFKDALTEFNTKIAEIIKLEDLSNFDSLVNKFTNQEDIDKLTQIFSECIEKTNAIIAENNITLE